MDNDKGRASDAPPVNDWPYETRSLVEAPGYERIEQHAVAVLNRALDLGRAVAFVGAGTSMSVRDESVGAT